MAANAWSDALTRYAKTDPRKLPSDLCLQYDEQTVTVYDGFPKARYHFLILPRIPFRLPEQTARSSQPQPQDGGSQADSEKPQVGLAGGKLVLGSVASSSRQSVVPESHLRSLSDLLRSPYAEQVLESLETAGRKAAQYITEKMPSTPLTVEKATEGGGSSSSSSGDTAARVWPVHMGFHAVPSMNTVHMHVISSDLVAEKLRHKKHYQSFHPSHGFWLPLPTVSNLVKSGAKTLPMKPKQYEDMLRAPLVSHINGQTYANMPKLKEHLESSWVKEMRRSRELKGSSSNAGQPSSRIPVVSTSPPGLGRAKPQRGANAVPPTSSATSNAPTSSTTSDLSWRSNRKRLSDPSINYYAGEGLSHKKSRETVPTMAQMQLQEISTESEGSS